MGRLWATIKWAEPSRDADDLASLSQSGWPAAEVESWTLADFFDGLISTANQLDDEQVMAAFVAGLQSAPRGRQVMVSYAFARALKQAPRGDDGYPDWGYQDDYPPQPLDVTEALLRIGLGWAWAHPLWCDAIHASGPCDVGLICHTN